MFTHYYREVHKRLVSEEKIFRFVNSIPGWFFSSGINTILGTGFFKYWLSTRLMQRWVETAYNKEIEVKLN